MNPTLGLQLSLSAIRAEFDQLARELNGVEDCLKQSLSPVITKLCLETIAKHARYVSHVASAEAEKQARLLNRHAIIAE